MSDVIDTAGAEAGTAEQPAVQVTAPASALQTPSPEARIAAAEALLTGAKPAPAVEPVPAPAVPGQKAAVKPAGEESIADLIRRNREERQANAQHAARAKTLEGELARTRTELEQARGSGPAFEDDPVGFAKARKWTPEQQLLYGQSLLYDLAPNKADPDFRVKMMADRQDRREREKAAKDAEDAKKAEAEAQQRMIQDFYEGTIASVKSFEAGSYPESEDWFGDDLNSYMQSLVATAHNLSEVATREGRRADLSAVNLAKVLEAETATRLAARDGRKQKRTPAQEAKAVEPKVGGVQPADTLSTRKISGTAAPRAPATSERERMDRASAVLFRTR